LQNPVHQWTDTGKTITSLIEVIKKTQSMLRLSHCYLQYLHMYQRLQHVITVSLNQ